MRRRLLLLGLAGLLAGSGAPAAARTGLDDLLAGIAADGFEILQVGRTWLGRIRILAQSPGEQREIVYSPSTGEILRDYTSARSGALPTRTGTAEERRRPPRPGGGPRPPPPEGHGQGTSGPPDITDDRRPDKQVGR
ncbi:hypothetical protein [Salipiger sp.]|uniref:hypothetical protein n=1 Tax=Salipiger sp. TaxID=2078585 RepID=UPI003A96FAD5